MGETVPIEERATTNGTVQTSVREQNISLNLKITPQINKVTRFIKLKIQQKIDDFSGRTTNTSSGVGKTIRNANTTVVVRDRDTIAMGGLMRDKETHQLNKVPLLGDIPVVGWLFKNKTKTTEKVNLLFFLTPRILANYQRTNAENVKGLLNRRNQHLKKTNAGGDPFETTVKGLYDKAQRQGEGPLYDKEEAGQYHRQNDGPGIGAEEEEEVLDRNEVDQGGVTINSFDGSLPSYSEIVQDLKRSQSGIQKTRGSQCELVTTCWKRLRPKSKNWDPPLKAYQFNRRSIG